MNDPLIERMTEIAHLDSAVSVPVRADDLRALLSKLRAPVADELPHWEETSAKLERDETLTPLELFIHENEPAGGDADAWREQLAAALASAPVAGEASPTAQAFAQLAKQYPVRPTDQAQHPDDVAVDRFAAAMKAKLAAKRAAGRGGWDDKTECSAEFLSGLLRGHVEKGDPLDVGNFAMMLHQRGERITSAASQASMASAPVAGEAQKPVAWLPDGCGPTKDPGIAQAWRNLGRNVRPLVYGDAAPQASEADPLQGAADWLMRAFEPPLSASDLARQLVIGYNRATRLRDAALSAQPGKQKDEPTSE